MKTPSLAPQWSKAKFRTQVRTRPRSRPPSQPHTQANTRARVETCQRIIGYRFRNINLIEEALTPRASVNRRLALAGDRAADLQLVARWYGKTGHLTPSQWDMIKSALLGNTNLAQVGKRLRIQDCLPNRCGSETMATTVEAIIGAVWMDSKKDLAAVGSVMDRFGLTRHPLLPSPPPSPTTTTTYHPPCEIWSSRPLPDRFFTGHHLGLLQLLFRYGQSSAVQQRAGQHMNLLHHEQRREEATERLPTDMWTRPKHILLAPQIMIEKAQKWIAARVGRKDEHLGQEPSTCEPSELPVQHAPAPVPATKEQTNTGHRVSALESTLPVQQPVTQSGFRSNLAAQHDEPTVLHTKDTEWSRINWFIWSIRETRLHPSSRRERPKSLLHRLNDHRRVLAELPDRSLKNIPDDCWPDGVCLAAHSSDKAFDKVLVRHIGLMTQQWYRMRNTKKRRDLQPEEESIRKRGKEQLRQLWLERLDLWLPTDAQDNQIPTSSTDLGPTSDLSSETTLPGSKVPAAVDSTAEPTVFPADDKRSHKPGPVLWTIDAGQNTSVDWKQYLRKPASQNE